MVFGNHMIRMRPHAPKRVLPIDQKQSTAFAQDARCLFNHSIFVLSRKQEIGGYDEVKIVGRKMAAPLGFDIAMHDLDIAQPLLQRKILEPGQHLLVGINGPYQTRPAHEASCSSSKKSGAGAKVGHTHPLMQLGRTQSGRRV